MKRSTDSELVSASYYVTYNIWYFMFVHHQGYLKISNRFLWDNQSAVRMKVNGRKSCTGKSRHIDIRYSFIKDRVYKEEISIVYCPTHLMLAGYFKKTLQGALFHNFRYIIMGRVIPFTLLEDAFSYTSKERVGKQIPPK